MRIIAVNVFHMDTGETCENCTQFSWLSMLASTRKSVQISVPYSASNSIIFAEGDSGMINYVPITHITLYTHPMANASQ